jgi:hypothetical protein
MAGLGILMKKGIAEIAASPLFALRHLDVVGLHHLEGEEIRGLLATPVGVTLAQADLRGMKERLLRHPWVKEVSLHKGFPDRLRVEIVERVPVAAVAEKGGQWFLVDRDGMILERVAIPPSGLSLFLASQDQAMKVGRPYEGQGFPFGLRLMAALEGEDFKPPFLIDVSQSNDAILQVEQYRIHFGVGGYYEKLRRFLDVKRDLEAKGIGTREIDLRFPGKVVVRRG